MPAKPLHNDVKLTKNFYMGLSDGVFLVCVVGRAPKTPSFTEYVEPAAQRVTQWQRIKEAAADQRLCQVYRSKEEFIEIWDRNSKVKAIEAVIDEVTSMLASDEIVYHDPGGLMKKLSKRDSTGEGIDPGIRELARYVPPKE